MGPRDSVIGCVLHVNARGSLGVYIYMASLGKAERECGREIERVCVWSA